MSDLVPQVSVPWWLKSTLAAACIGILQGCAISYVDADGAQHVLGLVDLALRPPSSSQTFAGDVVDLRSLGVVASKTPQGGYLSVGYSRQVLATLRDDALVVGDPLSRLASSPEPRSDSR